MKKCINVLSQLSNTVQIIFKNFLVEKQGTSLQLSNWIWLRNRVRFAGLHAYIWNHSQPSAPFFPP